MSRSIEIPAGRGLFPVNAKTLLSRYSDSSWGTRIFLWLRWIWTPYAEMASLMPNRGKILDGGSGHGLLSLTLALQSPSRQVEGVDHSPQRLFLARKAARKMTNLKFREGDFRRLPKGVYDGLAFVDVLHYLSFDEQEQLLKESFRRLRSGGMLLFRDVDHGGGPASFWNGFHEILMTRLGFTKAGGLHFRTAQEWEKLAQQTGFKVRSKPTGRFPFADVLFCCRKP